MQETRQLILEILHEIGDGTVDEIVCILQKRRNDDITPVTVRHHLGLLQQDDFITISQRRHKKSPGRPQHIYTLTAKALRFFPNNYQSLAALLLEQIQENLPQKQVNVILEGVAENMALSAKVRGLNMPERLQSAVEYLNQHGYQAYWEKSDAGDGYVLRTTNCPYHQLSHTTDALCTMDMRLISSMLGAIPRVMSRVSSGDNSCAYFIPEMTNGT
jgi:predicted ArsR family transcriptional regulator